MAKWTAEAFWALADRDGPVPAHAPELGPCWPWRGNLHHGYGPTRTAFRLANGTVPDTVDGEPTLICHHCDNPPCVNPGHLYAGNASTNVQDALARGRHRAPRYWLGRARNFSPEALANISAAARRGHPSTPETNTKIAARLYGRPLTEQHRAALKAAHQNCRCPNHMRARQAAG
jgi:hypothetical protein